MSRIDANLAPTIADMTRAAPVAAAITNDQSRQAFLHDQQVAAADPGAPVQANDIRATAQRLKQVIETASGQSFAFSLSIDARTKDVVTTFKDQSGHVIRELPSKEMRDLKTRIDELVGLLVNKRA